MKILIDIDEDVYTRLFDTRIQDKEIATDDVCEMARTLRHGTPLPEGHGRLIDADALIKEKSYCTAICLRDACDTCQYKCVAKYDINNAPTIIEADKEGD